MAKNEQKDLKAEINKILGSRKKTERKPIILPKNYWSGVRSPLGRTSRTQGVAGWRQQFHRPDKPQGNPPK
jgi:hypothetical protein